MEPLDSADSTRHEHEGPGHGYDQPHSCITSDIFF